MKRVVFIFLLVFALLLVGFIIIFPNGDKKMFNNKKNFIVRQPAVAGQFYPKGREDLLEQIEYFSESATVSQNYESLQALIVPHAGYIYSGQVMAAGFKLLAGKKFSRVIILGASHNFWFDGVAAAEADVWETPLGEVSVDQDFITQMISVNKEIFRQAEYHAPEHCLEVELPWLQYYLKKDFKIVPLLLGGTNQETQESLAETLHKLWDDNTLLVISSDLSHYPPYETAKVVDNKILQSISSGRAQDFYKTYADLEAEHSDQADTFACGQAAIAAGLFLAEKNNWSVEQIAYANSGDTEWGNKSRVVGYGAVVFYKDNEAETAKEVGRDLNTEEQKLALQYVRAVLENYFFGTVNLPDLSAFPIFQTKRGVFVTLHKRKGRVLRGCIGQIIPQGALADNLKNMALAAALEDPRFPPVSAEELSDLEIEISVLSPMKKIDSPKEIKLGKHGVMVKQGAHTGVFLPQVAEETGWSLEEFMSHLCHDKAGISPNAWQTGEADIYVFTAQVFSE